MMDNAIPLGRVLGGSEDEGRRRVDLFQGQPVDLKYASKKDGAYADRRTTVGRPVSVSGPGTFFRRAEQTLTFAPSEEPGWWIDRQDQPDELPIRVAIENVWTTGNIVSNIVLRSGSPHNYLRMVEHIIALKVGLGLDDVVVRVDSGDPPLFEAGSMDLVNAIQSAGLIERDVPADYCTVTEPVTLLGPYDSFLTLLPAVEGSRDLCMDCAIDFPNAIGRQRLQLCMTPEAVVQGAVARTNTNLWRMLYCKTIGKLFADVRNLGYTTRNLLIAGPKAYVNEPRLIHGDKALEAIWHRAVLDLAAAIALVDGRFAGRVISYKAGHGLDCKLITKLYQLKLLKSLD